MKQPGHSSATITLLRPARLIKVFLIMLALVIAAASTVGSTAAVTYPSSMAAMGDSITTAYNSGPSGWVDAPAYSWSTGTNTTVNSLYWRFLATNSLISGKNYNYAKTGVKVSDLVRQAGLVNGRNVDYVTILIGANDVCTSSESTMTSTATFRSQFESAMATLTTGSPNAQIYVVSIPDIYNLWKILKGNFSARFTWSLFRICQSMLANPSSTTSTNEQRRLRVRQRNIDFNAILEDVCENQYLGRCRFDNNAVFNTAFVASDVSTRDYFHPSQAGQKKLAATAWSASGFAP